MSKITFTSLRLDLDGQAFYFGVQAEPFTALRLVLYCLELRGLPFPGSVKLLKRHSGEDDHSVAFLLKDQNAGPRVVNPLEYDTLAGKAFWDLCGLHVQFEAEMVLQRKQLGEIFPGEMI